MVCLFFWKEMCLFQIQFFVYLKYMKMLRTGKGCDNRQELLNFASVKYIFLSSTIYSCLILLHSLNSLDSPMNQSSSKQFLIKNCSSIWMKIRAYNSRRNKEKNKNILNDRYKFCLKILLRNCDQLELIYWYMNNYQRACCLLTPLVFYLSYSIWHV